MSDCRLILGDAIEEIAKIPAGSIQLIATDPPYHRVKSEAWDRQWKTDADYLDWIGRLCGEWARVLAPNGSLYVFASPRMAAGVECRIGETFDVLNHIVWRKDNANADRRHVAQIVDKGLERSWLPSTERIIFAEHRGSDGFTRGESRWTAKCDELRGFVFEPILRSIRAEFDSCNLSRREVDEFFGTSNVSQYWLQERDFIIPTFEKWEGLRTLRPGFFRREYEDLRREYEDLRRPFSVSADVPYTDVWDFPTVSSRPGKHPCAKPVAMMEHIVAASSRPGDTVLDCFMGGGATGKACVNMGRKFIGIEKAPHYFAGAERYIAHAATPLLTG